MKTYKDGRGAYRYHYTGREARHLYDWLSEQFGPDSMHRRWTVDMHSSWFGSIDYHLVIYTQADAFLFECLYVYE